MDIGCVVYGSLDQTSGGYRYDRKLVEHLRAEGDSVDVISISQRGYAANLFTGLSGSLRRRLNQPYDILLQDELCHPSLWQVNRRLHEPTAIVSLVHLLRAGPPRRWNRLLVRRIERSYLRSVDATISTSNDTQRRVETLTDMPSLVAYPGGRTEQAALTPEDVRRRAHTDPLRVLFVGTVSPRKETLTLVDALNNVEGSWTADIVGALEAHPEYVARVQSTIGRHGLDGQITVHGPVSTDELTRLLQRSHVLIVPSQYESFGMVYLEAMEYGVVPIASAIGGASEYITDGESGFLVDPGNPGQIQTVVEVVQQNRELLASLAVGALKQAQTHPNWETSLSRVREFLLALADGETPAERVSNTVQDSTVN